MKMFLKRLRGAFGNALVWGASWFGASFALLTTLYLTVGLPVPDPWRFIFYVTANFGVTGFLTGGAFAAFVRLAYRNRPLLDINVNRFAMGGAVIAGLLSPAVTVIARMLAGPGVVLGDLIMGGIWAAVFGGVTAGFTVKLAQQASRTLSDTSSAELEVDSESVPALLGEEAG